MSRTSGARTLNQYRIERMMDVWGFAGFLGISTQTYYRISQGESIRFSTMQRIANKLRVKPTDISEFAAALQKQMEEAATPQPATVR